mgnify:FL=1
MQDPLETDCGKPSRRGAGWLIKLVVSGLLIAWVVGRADLAQVLAALKSAKPGYVVVAALTYPVGWTISITRWRLLLGAMRTRVPLSQVVQSYLSAIFVNNLLPSTVGGDALRIYDSWRWGAGKAGAVAVIAVDRLMGVFVLLAFAVGAMTLAPHVIEELPLLPLWMGMSAAALVGLAGAAFLPIPGVRAWAAGQMRRLPPVLHRPVLRFAEALRGFRDDPKVLLRALGLSVMLQLNVILHYVLLAKALSLPVQTSAFFLIIPISLAIMTIPITVNAIGLRENVFAFFLGMFGVPVSTALAFSWLAFGLVLLQGSVGGVVYALRGSGGVREVPDAARSAVAPDADSRPVPGS